MGLETGTHIVDLVVTNPVGTDDRSTADDHMRLIKDVLRRDLPLTGIVTSTFDDLNILSGAAAAGLTTAELLRLNGSTPGTVLTTGDAGSGSGLDADTVDGNHASAFAAVAAGVTNGNSHNHLGGDGALIPEGALVAGSVGQTALKTASQSVVGTAASNRILLIGGRFALSSVGEGFLGGGLEFDDPGVGVSKSTDNRSVVSTIFTGSYTSYMRITTVSAPPLVSNFRFEYVQASPPYDLGDGDIPGFIYALVNKATGEVDGMCISMDPPWMHNGPTDTGYNIRDAETGKRYRKQIQCSIKSADVITDPGLLDSYMEQILEPTYEYVEITQAVKNADKDVVPHPYGEVDTSEHTLVLLDPVSDLCRGLMALHGSCTEGVLEVQDMFKHRHLKFDNEGLERVGPAGVLCVKADFKRSGG